MHRAMHRVSILFSALRKAVWSKRQGADGGSRVNISEVQLACGPRWLGQDQTAVRQDSARHRDYLRSRAVSKRCAWPELVQHWEGKHWLGGSNGKRKSSPHHPRGTAGDWQRAGMRARHGPNCTGAVSLPRGANCIRATSGLPLADRPALSWPLKAGAKSLRGCRRPRHSCWVSVRPLAPAQPLDRS